MTRNSLRLALAGICTALAFTGCSFSVGDMKPIGGSSSGPSPARSSAPETPESSPSTPQAEPTDSPTPSGSSSGMTVGKTTVEVTISDKIKERTGQAVVVDCPSDLDATVGTTMTCEWTGGSDQGTMEVTVTSVGSDGKVNFRFREV